MTSVSYSARAAQALGLLKSSKNDIAIFVEDEASHNVWINILKSMLPAEVRLDSVNMLGSRSKVLDACRLDQAEDGRKRLYIIDADFDILLGTSKPRLKYLYRLWAYCLENYLLNEKQFCGVVMTLKRRLKERDVFGMYSYNSWIEQNKGILEQIFICYALVFKFYREIETISFDVNRLRRKGVQEFEFDEIKVRARVAQLYRRLLEKYNKDDIRPSYYMIRDNIRRRGVSTCVSGKSYLMPVVHQIFTRRFGVRIARESFCGMLAREVSAELDPYLKKRLNNILTQ